MHYVYIHVTEVPNEIRPYDPHSKTKMEFSGNKTAPKGGYL